MYQQVDQQELEKLGLGHKSELDKEQGSLKAMHKFSMLQRFRGNKDLKAVDKYKPKAEDTEDAAEIKEKENAFFKNNV